MRNFCGKKEKVKSRVKWKNNERLTLEHLKGSFQAYRNEGRE
jgi:hypothetical protein